MISLRVFLFSPISPMPSTRGSIEELGDELDHLARQRDVLGLLGVDAEPGVMLDAVLGGTLRLDIDQVPEVVGEADADERSNPAQNAGSETATTPARAM